MRSPPAGKPATRMAPPLLPAALHVDIDTLPTRNLAAPASRRAGSRRMLHGVCAACVMPRVIQVPGGRRSPSCDLGVRGRHVRLEICRRRVRRHAPLALERLEPEVHRRQVPLEVARLRKRCLAMAAGVRLEPEVHSRQVPLEVARLGKSRRRAA